jgi:hypothetical protein
MSLADDDQPDPFASVPQLPAPPVRRWTIWRKAAVIEGVQGGWIAIEEVCRVYTISVDEFLGWERDLKLFGVYGLRATRYQIYRNSRPRKPVGRPRKRSAESGMAAAQERC